MSDYAPRCPFCANVLKFQPSFWERIGLKSSKARCPTCQRTCDPRDAHTMGSAYGHWATNFRNELVEALKTLPVLSEPVMNRALGSPHRDDTRLMPSLDELVRTCIRHHRAVLVEMARGREATLDVVHLKHETLLTVEAAAILGACSAESGGREWQQIVARNGMSHFVLYTYPGKEGAEPRVKRAVHEKVKQPRSLIAAHVSAAQVVPLHKHAHSA